MNFTFHRDRTIASITGHSVFFPKGVPTYAPAAIHAEVLSAGGVPEDEMDDPRDPVAVNGVTEPTDPTERAKEIQAAIELIATRNTRNDFTAAGAPHVRALAQVLGWMPTSAERDTQWARFQIDQD